MSLTPEQRSEAARRAAYARWAAEDPKPAMAKARRGYMARFEREVDPDGLLPPQERTRRAVAAHRAHLANMRLRSSIARKRRSPKAAS